VGEDADADDGGEHGEPDPAKQRVEAAVLCFADDEALAGEDEAAGGKRFGHGGDADARLRLPSDFIQAVDAGVTEDSGGRVRKRAVQGCVAGDGLAGVVIEDCEEIRATEPSGAGDFAGGGAGESDWVGAMCDTIADVVDEAHWLSIGAAPEVLLVAH